MRLYTRNELLEYLTVMSRAHGIIKKNGGAAARDLLEQLLEMAAAMEDLIEKESEADGNFWGPVPDRVLRLFFQLF